MRMITVALAMIIMSIAAAAQQRKPAGSVCLKPVPAGVLINICEHEHGMAPIPQPRLYMRVYTDGRAEYETNSTADKLVRKQFRIEAEALQEIVKLGGSEEFQKAQNKYPAYVSGHDSWVETTITFYDKLVAKKIVLLNFFSPDRRLKPNYPAALFDLLERLEDLRNRAMGIKYEVPALNYCEMIKNRQAYAGKHISVYADMKLPYEGKGTDLFSSRQVVFLPGKETGGEYLYDAGCEGERAKSLRVSGAVGIALARDADAAKLGKQLSQLREDRFGGRARVWAEGVLHEDPGTDESYPYRYRFDLKELKDFQQMILPFQGVLEQGWIYSDTFDHTAGGMVIRLSQPFKRSGDLPIRIQWKNARDFSTALKTSGRKSILFRVILRTTDGVANNEMIYFCEILELK